MRGIHRWLGGNPLVIPLTQRTNDVEIDSMSWCCHVWCLWMRVVCPDLHCAVCPDIPAGLVVGMTRRLSNCTHYTTNRAPAAFYHRYIRHSMYFACKTTAAMTLWFYGYYFISSPCNFISECSHARQIFMLHRATKLCYPADVLLDKN